MEGSGFETFTYLTGRCSQVDLMFIRIELALNGRTKLWLQPLGSVPDLAIRPAESRAGKSAKYTHRDTRAAAERAGGSSTEGTHVYKAPRIMDELNKSH